MEKVLFKEEQRFMQWWLWAIIVAAIMAVVIPLVNTITDEQSQLNSSDHLHLILYGILAVLFFAVVIVTMLFTKLKTKITSDGIYIAYIPFIRKWKKITCDELNGYNLRKYRAVLEYGGHGMKRRRKAGKSYTTSGNIGLQLYLKDGKRLLIGTQKKQAIEYAMAKLFNDKQRVIPQEEVSQERSLRTLLAKKAKNVLIIIGLELLLAIVIIAIIRLL